MQPLALEKQFRCNLCNNTIKERQEITFCPNCMNGYHTPHLASWFYTNSDRCPNCDTSFDELLIRELRPHSDLDKWKLEVINILYNRQVYENGDGKIITTLRKLASLVSSPFVTLKDRTWPVE